MSLVRRLALSWLCVVVANVLLPAKAAADSETYCRKVRARAAADAAVRIAPDVVAQVIRFPSDGRTDLASGTQPTHAIQLRGGLSFSPVEALRGLRTMRVAEADCRQHDSAETLDQVLSDDTAAAELPAHRAQAEYLSRHQPEWRAIVAKADDRRKAGMITIMEFHELRRLTAELERKTAQEEGEVQRLLASEPQHRSGKLAALSKNYLEATDEFERQSSKLRSLDPWSFKITGGAVPYQTRQVNWFGFAELTYSLGGLVQSSQENRYLKARAEELRQARYEIPKRLALLEQQMNAQMTRSKRELEVVDSELSFIQKTRDALEGYDAPDVIHARATLAIERFSVESDAVYLRTLIQGLTSLLEQHHDA